MARFLLVPENFDLKEVKEVTLPKNIYNANNKQKTDVPQQHYKEPQQEIQHDSKRKGKQNVKMGRYLSPTVVKYASNRVPARKVLKFLKDKQFKQDKRGRLVFQNKVYPILLETSFLDLVNNAPKTKENDMFYKLLSKNGLDRNLVPKTKQKYFK